MEYELVQGALTLLLMCVFIGIGGWAWQGKQRARFDAASRLPFQEDEDNAAGGPR
jgi:cytochrome c oxidase cbb3-type subunit 4